MNNFFIKKGDNINMKVHFFILALCWSIIMLVAMGYEMIQVKKEIKAVATIQARTSFNNDVTYRRWNAMHGGVYVTVDESTQPNPYLHVNERDISTPSGRQLTLINPAYMTRQVHELQKNERDFISHITSLKPIRPENKADGWEQEALRQFALGSDQQTAVTTINGKSYFRFMKPLFVKKGCLKCHGDQGYKVGDIRGGISVAIPMDVLDKIARSRLIDSYLVYLTLWLLGLGGLGVGTWRLHLLFESQKKAQSDLADFKITLDNIKDCVFMFWPDTLRFFYFNKGAVKQVGYTEEELLTMTPLDIKPEFTEEDFRGMIEMLVKKERPSLTFETTHWHKDNGGIPVEVTMQYIVPQDGKGRCISIVRDISRQKKRQQEREQMQNRLLQSQKMESVGQLAAGIAHEINTPAQYVGSNIDFLDEAFNDLAEVVESEVKLIAAAEKEPGLTEVSRQANEALEEADWEYLAEEIPKAIKQSRQGIKQVTTIVRAMKEFSHPGSKEMVPADLNRIIKNTVTVARNEWKYVADVKLALDPELPSVLCLIDQMGQVILNITVNAAQAIKEKLGENPEGEKGIIKVVTGLKNNMAEIRIIDNGQGMPDVIKDKIFDPFFTTKEVGKGTGQGLAIARDIIVVKHKGSLTVESETGKGTVFIIRLPLER